MKAFLERVPNTIASPTLFICVVSVRSACEMVAVRKHLEGKARYLGEVDASVDMVD